MITTACVDDDLIEQFIDYCESHEGVVRATQAHGRAVDVVVEKIDGDWPEPWTDDPDIEWVDGEWHADDYVISKLAGGGHKPGDKLSRRVGISPYCVVCGDRPQSNDHGRCGACDVQEGLLTGPAGETAIVQAVHDDDGWGKVTDPGQVFEATAGDDGILRADLEYRDELREGECLNADAHSIVRWKSNTGDGDD